MVPVIHVALVHGENRPAPPVASQTGAIPSGAFREEDQILYVLLEVFASAQSQKQRLPFNLCLVVDRSTSMQGVRLQRVKDATNFIIDFLNEGDVFSLVTFNDRAEIVIPAQSQLDKAVAKSRVSTIRSSGGTEILQGLELGCPGGIRPGDRLDSGFRAAAVRE